MPIPGDVLEGRYCIERILGSGGCADVFQARDIRLGKPVAIKASRPQAGMEATCFEREAMLLAELDHPAVVPVTDFFVADGQQYLVMARVEGRDLQQVLDQTVGYLQPLQVLGWIDEVCDALEYLHGRPAAVIVRDLKPSNLMLDVHGRVRLIDFGIARRTVVGRDTTAVLKGLGTDGYSPVEQYTGAPTDARSDIYSLGATAYTLLTRVVPAVSVARLSGDAVLQPPVMLNPDISLEFEAVLLKMMALQKADRYQSAALLRADLRRLIEQASGGTPACAPSPLVPPAPAVPVLPMLGCSPQEPALSSLIACSEAGRRLWREAQGNRLLELRFLSPFTTVFSGSRDQALQALRSTLAVGLSARLIPDWDPLMRGVSYMVVVEHRA